jgi:TetR/AcrR family transcriptional regulator, regulator of cefoperazone and chloramphenicol sensitivity
VGDGARWGVKSSIPPPVMAISFGDHRYPGSMSEPRRAGRRQEPKVPALSSTTGARPAGSDEDEAPIGSRELLIRAGERLFARHGIHRVRLREINDLAEQRNPSAVHYHFGSREGLVEAILAQHELSIETAMKAGLDRIENRKTLPSVREVMAVTIHPLIEKLETESGRDYLRIIQQLTPMLSANLRRGITLPTPPEGRRALAILEQQLTLKAIPQPVRRERLVAYVLSLVGLLADRAHETERGRPALLEPADFESNLLDMLVGALTASPSIGRRRGQA